MRTPRSLLPIAVVCVFFALTLAVHHKVFTAPMQYDSAGFLLANEYVFTAGLGEVVRLLVQRPVPMVTFYFNYLVDGMNPYYFRVANAFLMACAAGTVVLLFIYILEIPGLTVHGTARQKRMVSIGLGLVFLLHPANIYVVLYVWQRMALLSGLFLFPGLSLVSGDSNRSNPEFPDGICHLRYYVFPRYGKQRKRYCISWGAAAGGICSL